MPQLRLDGVRIPRGRFPNANPETDLFPTGKLYRRYAVELNGMQGWYTGESSWVTPPPKEDPLYVTVNNSEIATRNTTDFTQYSGGIGGPCDKFVPPFRFDIFDSTTD